MAVAAADRHPGDEVVEHELVQDDDARAPSERVDDPAVRVRVVADVVERDVRCGGARPASATTRSRRAARERRAGAAPSSRRSPTATAAAASSRRPSRRAARRSRVPGARARRSPCRPAPTPARRRRARGATSTPGERGGPRLDDEPGLAVGDDLERPAGVGRRHDRLLGEERLVRDHPEVLVDRRVVDGEAARVESRRAPPRRRGRRSATRPLSPCCARALEPLAVGAVAGDHDAQPRVARRRLDQQVDPLRAVEAVDREDEVARSSSRAVRRAPAAGAAAPRPRARSSARSRSATFREVAKSLRASPSATRSSRCTARRVARSSGDSANWPSSVRSSS